MKKTRDSAEEATQELKQVQKEHEEARAELTKLEDEATVVMDEYKKQEIVCLVFILIDYILTVQLGPTKKSC